MTSTGGDHFVWFGITGHAGETGNITIQATTSGASTFDIYSDFDQTVSFTDHLVAARIADLASTRSALVAGAYGNKAGFTDVSGVFRDLSAEGGPGQLWIHSAGGPTRDGRIGVDLTTPGHNLFAPISTTSLWSSLLFNQPQGNGVYYSRHDATSGASPILVGAVSLLLQMKPDLTSEQARDLLHATAVSDDNTGDVPNNNWGYGKPAVSAAVDALCARYQADDAALQAKCHGSLLP